MTNATHLQISRYRNLRDNIERHLIAGHPPEGVKLDDRVSAIKMAAIELGYSNRYIKTRIREASKVGIDINWSLWVDPMPDQAPAYIAIPGTKPRVTVVADTRTLTNSEYRVVVIGDAHDHPEIEKDRFLWIGKFISEVAPDAVVQIGDIATLDSLNTYIPNHAFDGKAKPYFMRDLASLEEALGRIDEGIGPSGSIIRHITLGNHERRLWNFEDKTPEIYGMMQTQFTKLLEAHGWTWSEYGEFYFIGGVGFIHVPLNELGKAYGGKTANHRVCLDATFDIVWGHSHKDNNQKLPKLGPRNYVRSLNVGCAMDHGHVEKYARHATTGWSWGVYEIGIRGGHITSWNWVPMLELQRRYG